jgi:hypothetical protein
MLISDWENGTLKVLRRSHANTDFPGYEEQVLMWRRESMNTSLIVHGELKHYLN